MKDIDRWREQKRGGLEKKNGSAEKTRKLVGGWSKSKAEWLIAILIKEVKSSLIASKITQAMYSQKLKKYFYCLNFLS